MVFDIPRFERDGKIFDRYACYVLVDGKRVTKYSDVEVKSPAGSANETFAASQETMLDSSGNRIISNYKPIPKSVAASGARQHARRVAAAQRKEKQWKWSLARPTVQHASSRVATQSLEEWEIIDSTQAVEDQEAI